MSEREHVFRPNPFILEKFKMHEKCSHCGLKYQIEPSFMWTMYVSYRLNVATGIAALLFCDL
jgi:hypothetical protein